jgi:hypothetical protein
MILEELFKCFKIIKIIYKKKNMKVGFLFRILEG